MAKPKSNLVKRCWPWLGKRLIGKRLGRVKRWCVRVLVGLPLLLVATVVIVTQTSILGAILLPRMSAALGMEISSSRVYLARTGRLVLLDVTVHVPDVQGVAGEFVRVERLDAAVRWWPTLLGDPTLTQVVATSPLVRLSQSIDDGTMNVAWIPTPPGGVGDIGSGAGMGTTTLSLFEIVVNDMTLEVGEHSQGVYHALKRIEMNGRLSPSGEQDNARYEIAMEGNPIAAGGERLRIEGHIDPQGMVGELFGFALHDWTSDSIPAVYRAQMEALDLRGHLERTVFIYEIGKGLTAKVVIRDGEMNLPISAESEHPDDEETNLIESDTSGERLRVTAVNGGVTLTPDGLFANATGLVGDLPTQIILDVDGLDLNSPFTLTLQSKGFSLEKNPDLLPFAPNVVRERLLGFSSPTGKVDTRVTVVRGPATKDGPGLITFSGELLLTEGVAAYAKIPYTFENITARMTFDQDRVDIVRIEGESASGARVTGSGWIAPPSGNSEVVLDLKVTNLPTDERLRTALGTKYGPIVDSVFDHDAYQQLLDRGLIITRDQQIDLNRQLADPGLSASERLSLRQRLARPMFDLGGVGEVAIHLRRPPMEHTDWEVELELTLVEGGLLPHAFPMPFIAQGVSVWTDLSRAELRSGSFRGVGGGTATVRLDIDLIDGFHPDITIDATKVPVEELLVSAIPETEDDLSGRAVLRGLGVQGLADINVHVIDRENGTAGFDAVATFDAVSLSPRRRDRTHGVWSRGASGVVHVSESSLQVQVEGDLERNADEAAAEGPAPGTFSGHLKASTNVVFGKDDDPTIFDSTITLTDADARTHVEDFISVFSEPAAEQVESLRQVHDPIGRLNANVSITNGSGGDVETVVRVSGVRDAQLDLLDGRVAAAQVDGEVAATIGSDNVFAFHNLRSEISFEGMAVGTVELNGDAPMSLFAGEDFGPARARPFAVGIEDGRFESPLTSRIVERFLSPRTQAWYNETQPSGVYNALTQITGDGASGTLNPSSFAYDNEGTRAEYENVQGAIAFHPGGGSIRDVRARGDMWSLTAQGKWEMPSEGVVSLDANFTVRADRLTESLRTALPLELRTGIENLAFGLDGPISAEGNVLYAIRSDFEDAFVEATTSGTFAGVTLLAGVQVDDCTGSFTSTVSVDPGEAYSAFDINLDIDQMLASGIAMNDAQVHVTRDLAGALELTSFTGGCHGGTVTADARVWPTEDGISHYLANIQLASVRLSPVLADMDRAKQALKQTEANASPGVMGTGTAIEPAVQPEVEPDGTRGMVEGNVSIGGVVGDPTSRRGTGRFRVAGGEVLKSPTLVMLIELTSWQFPAGATLDYATLDFFVDGDMVAIEDFSIYSSRIRIRGFGTLDWLTQELDMRFLAGSANEIPFFSSLFGAWRNLISVEVTGKVGDQKIVPTIFEPSSNPFRGAIRLGGRNMDGLDDIDLSEPATVTKVIEEDPNDNHPGK
jgi:hypothetical protein